MKKDVSIILPSIRPQFLETFYASVQTACQNHTFEIVIPTPFDVPDDIKRRENVKILKTHTTPTVAKQMAIQLCNSEFLYNCTDDGFMLENVIDDAIEMHRKDLSSKDVVNMIYVEGVLDPITLQPKTDRIEPWPSSYWHPWSHPELRIPGIKPEWRVSLHFFMKLDCFMELGGLDCQWEYSNHAIHDIMYRAQQNGGKIIDFPRVAYVCSHFPNRTGDHGPINDAQSGPDTEIFNRIYNEPDAAEKRLHIPYDNWKNYPDVWKRRFSADVLPITRTEYEQSI
jgi:hypothetical protein